MTRLTLRNFFARGALGRDRAKRQRPDFACLDPSVIYVPYLTIPLDLILGIDQSWSLIRYRIVPYVSYILTLPEL